MKEPVKMEILLLSGAYILQSFKSLGSKFVIDVSKLRGFDGALNKSVTKLA